MMHWRHKMALERFSIASRPLTFHRIPGVGETTWKTLMQNQWIECADLTEKGKWWEVGWRLSDAGRAALVQATVRS